MFFLRILAISLCTAAMGCSTHEIKLAAAPGQESIVRDGVPALVSHKRHVVMIRPNSVLLKNSARPAFTVAVRNMGGRPEILRVSSITATQVRNAKQEMVKVFSYEELLQEEETRQALQAFAAALGGVGRAMSAANAGYVNTTGSVQAYGPYGPSYATYSAQTYDPLRAQIAQDIAASETRADFAALRQQGERNLMALQRTILKDNTVMAGEWIGGTVVMEQPVYTRGNTAPFTVKVEFGGELHEFQIAQLKK
jgi:hypothetical protein